MLFLDFYRKQHRFFFQGRCSIYQRIWIEVVFIATTTQIRVPVLWASGRRHAPELKNKAETLA